MMTIHRNQGEKKREFSAKQFGEPFIVALVMLSVELVSYNWPEFVIFHIFTYM